MIESRVMEQVWMTMAIVILELKMIDSIYFYFFLLFYFFHFFSYLKLRVNVSIISQTIIQCDTSVTHQSQATVT